MKASEEIIRRNIIAWQAKQKLRKEREGNLKFGSVGEIAHTTSGKKAL